VHTQHFSTEQNPSAYVQLQSYTQPSAAPSSAMTPMYSVTFYNS